jgi:hypothetical protein
VSGDGKMMFRAPQGIHQGLGDRAALVGRPGGSRGAFNRMTDIGAGERPKPETPMQLASVFQAGLIAPGVLSERIHGRVDLVRQKTQHRRWDGLAGAKSETWVTEQRELHRGAELIARAVPSVDPFQVLGRQRVMARHLSVIDRKFEQPASFVTREQASARHGCLRRVWGGSQFTKYETPNRRIDQAPGSGGVVRFLCPIAWFSAQTLR